MNRRRFLKYAAAGATVAGSTLAGYEFDRWQTSLSPPSISTRPVTESVTGPTVTREVTTTQTVRELVEPPRPTPVEEDVQVAAYYLTGWGTFPTRSSDWSLGAPYHALLGNYKSNDPIIADWHIMWARSHGIGAFFVPYSDARLAQRRTGWEYNLETGLMRAGFFNQIKFAVWFSVEPYWPGNPWGNNPNEIEELIKTTITYFASNFFHKQNYLKISDRPVLILGKYQYSADNLGLARTRNIAALSRAISEDAGFSPYLVGDLMQSWHDDPDIDQLVEDVDGVTAYNILDPGNLRWRKDNRGRPIVTGTYEEFVREYLSEIRFWSNYARDRKKAFIPPVCPGFTNRILFDKGIDNWLAEFTGSSAELFRKVCLGCKPYVDSSLNTVVVEAWNEFQEGSVIEPTTEQGFSYLQALRETFAKMPKEGWSPEIVPSQIYRHLRAHGRGRLD